MKKKENRAVKAGGIWASPFMTTFIAKIVTIIIGLMIGLILLLFTSGTEVAIPAFKTIITGSFGLVGFRTGMGRMLYYAVPILMTGLSVGFALRTGVFNIGAPGQFLMGLYAGLFAGIHFAPALGGATWVAAIIAGALAGGVWGLIQGMLQAYKKMNAIICGIMMNYVALYLVNMLIRADRALYFGGRSYTNSLPGDALLPRLGMNNIFTGSAANSGIIIGIAVCVAAYFILKKTTLGYELKATGLNREAARYAGIKVERVVAVSMMISGVFAALGGVLYHNGAMGQKYTLGDALRPEGFTGIPVALLGSNHPIAIIFSALFISYLQVGGLGMQSFGIESEIVTVITSITIFFCSFNVLFQKLYIRLIDKLFEGRA
ncbi:MAG: ABC transporter permease [Clostridiales Family XIII bacterium]|nr:ABC transporter permease [Clostridiales Family XIII bacterium]